MTEMRLGNSKIRVFVTSLSLVAALGLAGCGSTPGERALTGAGAGAAAGAGVAAVAGGSVAAGAAVGAAAGAVTGAVTNECQFNLFKRRPAYCRR